MELLKFEQSDGKDIYINPAHIAVIQSAHNNSTYMWVSGAGFSLKENVDAIRARLCYLDSDAIGKANAELKTPK